MAHPLAFYVTNPTDLKAMKTISIISAIFSGLAFTEVRGQDLTPAFNQSFYTTAIGLRAGETSGLTIKHFTGSNQAVEGIIGIWPNAISLTALYERHASGNTEGFSWYYGAGGHVAFETGRIYRISDRSFYYRYPDREVGIGIDGILGLEYKIPPIPFALSLDLKPFVEINTGGIVFIALDPGLGIKVTF